MADQRGTVGHHPRRLARQGHHRFDADTNMPQPARLAGSRSVENSTAARSAGKLAVGWAWARGALEGQSGADRTQLASGAVPSTISATVVRTIGRGEGERRRPSLDNGSRASTGTGWHGVPSAESERYGSSMQRMAAYIVVKRTEKRLWSSTGTDALILQF